MALYGGARDVSMFRRVNRELMGNIISQEVIFYKYNVTTTKTNMYGESVEGRNFADPIILFALVEVGPQEFPTSDIGVDFTWTMTFRFLRDDLLPYELVPEIGDVILWNKDYYEVDNIVENQLIVGKDPNYAITNYLDQFGSDFSIIVNCHYTRPEKLNIDRVR